MTSVDVISSDEGLVVTRMHTLLEDWGPGMEEESEHSFKKGIIISRPKLEERWESRLTAP